MRALFLLALGTLSTTALAGSELQLKSSMPVNLYIDGEEAGTVQPLEALRVDIEAGVHNLKIKGLLGKDLYDRDLIFDDDTRTELIWQRKELRLGQVVQLDPNRPDAEPEVPVAPEEPEQVAAAPAAPAAPPLPQAAPPAPAPQVAQAPATPAPAPVFQASPQPAPQPQVVYVQTPPPQPQVVYAQPQPTYAATAPQPAPQQRNGSVVIQATENLDLQITHGTQLLRISVENGELVLRDSSGTQIRFPKNGQAF